MSVAENARYMTLRDALNYFHLDYKIVNNDKIKVYDSTDYFDDYCNYDDDELCSNGEEALDYGVSDSIVNDYFYDDEYIVPKEFRNMTLEEIYDYYEANGIDNDYKEIIGAVSGRIPIIVEEGVVEDK